MKRRHFSIKKTIILAFMVLPLCLQNSFAGGKKDKPVENTNTQASQPENKNEKKETNQQVKIDNNSTKMPSGGNKKGYFYKIDPEVISLVEDGSPESLKEAMKLLRKNEAEYTENEKVLIYIAASIMEIVWEADKVEWTVYPVSEENLYTGAVKSVKNGIFDSSTGNEDFLSTIIPTFVYFTSIKQNDNLILQCKTSVDIALKFNSESVLANYIAGVIYEKQSDYEKSEKYLAKAYSTCSNVKQICVTYARVLSHNGKNELATTVVSTVSSSNVDDIQVLKQSAYIAFNNGDLDRAEEYVARVLQKTPNDLEFVLFRAKIFIQKNDYIHAVSLLDMYARQNDKDLEYLLLRAKVQLDWSKNTAAATETVEKALKLYPDSDDALMLAAKISSLTDSPVAGKYADELANMVLKKNPENTNALIYALDGLIQRKEWSKAYEISSQLIQKSPNNTEIISRHVKVCINNGKKNEAFETAQKAYNSNTNDETIIQTYVYAYCETNNRDSSLNLINKLMNETTSQQVISYLYYQRSYLQRSEDTIFADLLSSLIANPRNSDSLFRLYEIYYEKKDYKKAQYYLKQVVAINPNDSSLKKKNEALTQLIK